MVVLFVIFYEFIGIVFIFNICFVFCIEVYWIELVVDIRCNWSSIECDGIYFFVLGVLIGINM